MYTYVNEGTYAQYTHIYTCIYIYIYICIYIYMCVCVTHISSQPSPTPAASLFSRVLSKGSSRQNPGPAGAAWISVHR